jgi:hypothetical protein
MANTAPPTQPAGREKRKVILRKMEDYLIFEEPGGCAVTYWTARSWVMNKRIKGIHARGSLWAGCKHETTWYDATG